jgi:glycosyltransferase involved in cell wall biosynthesis
VTTSVPAVELSFVTSMFRSAPHLEAFCARAAAASLTASYEIVLVNDGSEDASLPLALEIRGRDPRVRVIDRPYTIVRAERGSDGEPTP